MATLLTAILRFCYIPVQNESNKNFWTQTAFNWKSSLTTYGKFSKILTF